MKTQSELHAMRYVEELEEYPDLLVVAGGDGIGESAEIPFLVSRLNLD